MFRLALHTALVLGLALFLTVAGLIYTSQQWEYSLAITPSTLPANQWSAMADSGSESEVFNRTLGVCMFFDYDLLIMHANQTHSLRRFLPLVFQRDQTSGMRCHLCLL